MRLEHTGQACIGAWAFCTSGSLCRLISVWAFCTSGSLCTHNVFADTWMHGPFAQVAVFAHISAWAPCTSGSLCTRQCALTLHKWQSVQTHGCMALCTTAVCDTCACNCADTSVHGPLRKHSLCRHTGG